ncbi:EAL domain, c-di-GMP-specific phosphodiesterase class I (or its enzymatically inactive variant) [Devosia crocina]|uniref:EAL domain, c-di-GMP-specific phosphodiesterase class I (Or its enzymatically inactive variant) n=1 Tax=Devosia crocina TaxID=429728 RepID=A0A1I7NAK2_9HYPH|nr:EAL domain-containing protein [Devosia crocina]SFV31679.1 EAL domain, c-di-GMP-specific phosphodiesterase class I (or its enzymatically inactive variant) [Devosia crocina]
MSAGDDRFDIKGLTKALDEGADSSLRRALEAVREHLGMQVAYVSEFVGDRTIFREVDAPGLEHVVKPGDSMPLDYVYCRHILEGRLPELMPDVLGVPFAVDMPFTHDMGVRAHMSVPIKLRDGKVHGMFCCISTEPQPSLNPRDLRMMRAVAELAAILISREIDATTEQRVNFDLIRRVLDNDELAVVVQPIFRIADNRLLGFECLSRFSGPEQWTPDVWFTMAASVGLGTELEMRAVEKGLALLDMFPDDIYLTFNVSPDTVISGSLAEALPAKHAGRVVVEITEHASVQDYGTLVAALNDMREKGVRLAVDDAGAGYASLRHILTLQPDIIKLDISLTRNIQDDLARHALAAALVHFGRETKSQILAEGVETAVELSVLGELGVETAQGYFLGRPMPTAEACLLVAQRQLADRARPKIVASNAKVSGR